MASILSVTPLFTESGIQYSTELGVVLDGDPMVIAKGNGLLIEGHQFWKTSAGLSIDSIKIHVVAHGTTDYTPQIGDNFDFIKIDDTPPWMVKREISQVERHGPDGVSFISFSLIIDIDRKIQEAAQVHIPFGGTTILMKVKSVSHGNSTSCIYVAPLRQEDLAMSLKIKPADIKYCYINHEKWQQS